MMGNEADALDATQDALIAVTRGLKRFDGRARFTTWSYRVVTNACLDELRRRKRRPDPGLDEQPEAVQVAPGPATDSMVIDRLDVDAALQQIPEDFRTAVVLRDLCDLGYAEIAESLGIPPGTVRSRISRGRAALAQLLAGNSDPPSERQNE